jgi:hypothetical protein
MLNKGRLSGRHQINQFNHGLLTNKDPNDWSARLHKSGVLVEMSKAPERLHDALKKFSTVDGWFSEHIAGSCDQPDVLLLARNGHCGSATACPLSEAKRKTCARLEYFAF